MKVGNGLRVVHIILFVSIAGSANAQFGEILRTFGLDGAQQGLSDETLADGLKEALRVGTGNAVERTGTIDGYFGNEAIRILMPDELKNFERGLRIVGYGQKVDEFVLSMNRAAERAAPFAADIFWGAIRRMSFEDVRAIFHGGDTAATEYFRTSTTEELTSAFLPVVRESMDSVGVTRRYRELTGRFGTLPFAGQDALDLDQYVVGKALDGLFHVLAEEERKIRTDPEARVTPLLRHVFGGRGNVPD